MMAPEILSDMQRLMRDGSHTPADRERANEIARTVAETGGRLDYFEQRIDVADRAFEKLFSDIKEIFRRPA